VDGRLTLTHCPYCSLQCGITLRVAPDRVHLAPQEDFPTNRGGLCSKGWNAAELLDHPERLTEPLVRDRRDAPLKPTTWDDALDLIATRIRAAATPDAFALYLTARGITNETYYAAQKATRAIGTNNAAPQ